MQASLDSGGLGADAHLQSRTGSDRTECPPARFRRALAPPAKRFRTQLAESEAGSTRTPGPCVEVTATRFKNVPLAPDGFALVTASAKARMFSSSACSVNEALPTPAWTIPAFSTRNSTAPPF